MSDSYGNNALKFQLTSPLSAMLDWQKLQQGVAQTGLTGAQAAGAGIDNQSKLLNLDISRRFAGMAGVGGSATPGGAAPSGGPLPSSALLPGGAPAGEPGAGQGGASAFGGFQPQQITPYAFTSPFGVPFSQMQMLGIAQSPDKIKAMSEAYNMNRQAVAQTLTQAGDISQLSPGTPEYERTAADIRQGFTQLYLNGQIDQKAYVNGMQHPERANAFIAATASPDAHMAQATAMMGHAFAKDENGNVVPDRGALAGSAAKEAAVTGAAVPAALRTAAGKEAIGAPYAKPEKVEEQVQNPDGTGKVDERGEPVMRTRYIQPGVPTGPTAMPGAAGAVAAGNAAAGVGAPGQTLRGPDGSTVSPNAGAGGNPLLGGIAGNPGSVAARPELGGAPASSAPSQPFGNAPPPPPLPPMPAVGAAPTPPAAAAPGGAPAAPIAAPGATLGGMPVLTPTQEANRTVDLKGREADIDVAKQARIADIEARAKEVQKVSEAYGDTAGKVVAAGSDTAIKMQRLDVLQNAVADFRPGATAELRASATKRLVDAIQAMGGTPPDWMLKGATGAEVIGKEGGYLAAEMTRMLGAREAASVFNQIKSIQPGLELSTGGFQAIVNSIRQGVERDRDMFDYQEQWLKSHNTTAGMTSQFNSEHPVEAYASRVIPYPMPPKSEMNKLVPNTIYAAPNGHVFLWTGQGFMPPPAR